MQLSEKIKILGLKGFARVSIFKRKIGNNSFEISNFNDQVQTLTLRNYKEHF